MGADTAIEDKGAIRMNFPNGKVFRQFLFCLASITYTVRGERRDRQTPLATMEMSAAAMVKKASHVF